MNAIILFMGLLGVVAGLLSKRLKASGRVALVLGLLPMVAFGLAMGSG